LGQAEREVGEPLHLREVRTSYDTVADNYADLLRNGLDGMPLYRAMLAAFAELVLASGGGPVVDVGCGPGHVTAHLADLGLAAFGIDLSPGMVEVARREYPGLRFDVGSMTAPELADSSVDGVVSWWSIVHTPREVLPLVFAELTRVLTPGGHLLVGFHVGDRTNRKKTGYGGLPMALDVHLVPVDLVAALLAGAGLEVIAQLVTEPDRPGGAAHACLLARKPVGQGRN
jgi:SAM-dependent methyltransferase